MRRRRYFVQLLFVNAAGSNKLELHNIVIFSARIATGAKLSDLHNVYPEQVSNVVANEHRRVLETYNSSARDNMFVANV